jgi:hypothetical protein
MIANRIRYIFALTAAGLSAATAPTLAEIVSYKAAPSLARHQKAPLVAAQAF